MRRLLAWIGGVLGGIAAIELVRRRREPAHQVPAAPPAGELDPRAEALRAKLSQAREPDPAPGREPEPPTVGEGADPDERRRSVHEAGRAALEEMRAGEPEP